MENIYNILDKKAIEMDKIYERIMSYSYAYVYKF
jgi:hypothetical protein